jgi:acyl dehydratase
MTFSRYAPTVRIEDLRVGASFGPGRWIEVTQGRVDSFGDATDDHQWIHVDPDRARTSPWGGTIAHGWLSLALVAPVVFELLPLERTTLVNYGADRVRFPAPVPTGTRLRGRLTIREITHSELGTRIALDATMERDGDDRGKPVCVARVLLHAATSD